MRNAEVRVGPAPTDKWNAQHVRSERLVFIDVLRLIAAAQMIQGHSIAAMLAPSARHGVVFSVWSFLRGLTSVMFLFSAGFSLALADRAAHSRAARVARARRALRLVALGYLLHAPLAILFGADVAPTLRAFAAADVLQCIGCSLLLLEGLASALASQRGRALGGLLLGILCFGAAPWAQKLPTGQLVWITNYLNNDAGSQFPLLPWAGYVCVGFALASWGLHSERCSARQFARLLAGAAALSLALGLCLMWTWPGQAHAVSPGYALVKLACVLALAALLARTVHHRLPWPWSVLAAETLFLYVSHVLLLYADGVGLAHWLGDRHGPAFGVLVALGLMLLCSLGALGLRSLRARAAGGTSGASS